MNLTSTELLQTIENRGARVTLATGDNGAMKLQIAPNGLVSDLVSDIRDHARELRELIQSPPRWSEPPTAATPAVAALARELQAARRGAWISPTPALRSIWRELQTYTGARITARHLGALARLHAQHGELDNDELLELWMSGLQPDEGDGNRVWQPPEELARDAHASTRAAATPP